MQYKKIKGVIFDLDGTLLNTLKDIADSMNYVLRKYNKPINPIESYRNFVGDGVENLVKRAAGINEKNEPLIKKMVDEFKKQYNEWWNKSTVPYPGIKELLHYLHSEKIFIGVFSNKPDELTKKSINYFFPNIHFISVIGEGIFPRKPDPAGVIYIINLMGIKRDECLYVGDSKTDIETAKGAGIKSVGVLWGFRNEEELRESGACFIVSKPSQIIKIIEGE